MTLAGYRIHDAKEPGRRFDTAPIAGAPDGAGRQPARVGIELP